MDSFSLRFPGAILLSILIALILSITHLPEAFQPWRPEWVGLALVHWGMLFPKKNHYLTAWVAGLLVDSLLGNTLGQHALGYVIILFISIRMSERITPNTPVQHLFLVFITIGTYMLVNLWVLGILDEKPNNWSYWYPLFSSLLIWPLVHALLNRLHVVNRTI